MEEPESKLPKKRKKYMEKVIDQTLTKLCKECNKELPIDKFEIELGGKARTQCRQCKNKLDYEREQLAKKLEEENSNGCSIPKSQGCGQRKVYISALTCEELLRRRIWYDEPKFCGNKLRWVEPIAYLIKRLATTSSVEKVYSYKTAQKKRSKRATISKTIDAETVEYLKEIKDGLKLAEPTITYDEIVWRLIQNDKTEIKKR